MNPKKWVSTILSVVSLLVILAPAVPAQAITYSEIASQGKVLGDSTATFYPYPTGTLVNDSGTIYFISGTTKVPFTNWQAFVGLGYALKNVVVGDLTNYSPSQNYNITTANAAHPWGSWLIYKGTVYYSTQQGLIGVPNVQAFTSNGGDWTYIVRANSYDIAALQTNPNLPVLADSDPRVNSTPTYQFSNSGTSGNQNQTSALSIVTTNLPPATIGQSYSAQVQASGGVAPYTWSTISTTYPTACCTLGINNNGSIFNTQTAATVQGPAGTYTWVLQVTDSAGNTATGSVSLTINPASSSNSAGSSVDVPTSPVLSVSSAPPTEWLLMASKSPSGDTVFYTVNWGDGTQLGYFSGNSGQLISEQHTYASPGTYTISVAAATANSNEISSTIQAIVNLNATTPLATVSPTMLNLTAVEGSNSTPQPVTVSWPNFTAISGVNSSAVLVAAVSSDSLQWLSVAGPASQNQGTSILDLPANGTFTVWADAGNLAPSTYNAAILINNISGSVPAVSITIPVTLTVAPSGLSPSLNSALPQLLSVNAAANQKVASFQITDNSQSSANISSLTYYTTRNTIGSNFQNLKLMVNGSQVGATQSSVSSNATYVFNFNSPLVIPAGGSIIVDSYVDVAAGVNNSTSGVSSQNLLGLSGVSGTWSSNNASITSMTPAAVAGQAISFPN